MAALVGRWASAAQLQESVRSSTGDYAAGGGAQVSVTFRATLQTAVELSVAGASDGEATTSITGAGSSGSVDFGTFNTLCSEPVQNGKCVVATEGEPGATLVAAFVAKVQTSGISSADIGLARVDASDATPSGTLLAAVGPTVAFPLSQVRFAPGTATNWKRSGGGAMVPLAANTARNLASAVRSGTALTHQVALFFPSDAPPGSYSTVVRWTATGN